MTKKIRIDIVIFMLVSVIIITALVTALVINKKVSDLTQVQSTYSKLRYMDKLVDERYIGSVDAENLADSVARGYVDGLLDNYAQYYTAKEYETYSAQLSGEYDGVGLTAAHDGEDFTVVYVSSGSPADSAGLKPGDIITKIGEFEIEDISNEQADKLLKISPGESIDIKVKRNGEVKLCKVAAAKYKQNTVSYHLLGYVGYISISYFNDLTPEYFSDAVDDLILLGAQRLVIDVRNNPGGSIESVVKVVDRLVGTGTVATAVYKKTDETGVSKKVYEAVTPEQVGMDMVVLCNNATASGGELFASAMNDFAKAKVVGNTTFGKGTGQSVYKLADGSYFKFTDFAFYPPSGTSFNLIGFTPALKVNLPDNVSEVQNFTGAYKDDVYILKAFEVLGVDPGVLETIEK